MYFSKMNPMLMWSYFSIPENTKLPKMEITKNKKYKEWKLLNMEVTKYGNDQIWNMKNTKNGVSACIIDKQFVWILFKIE